MEFDLRCRKVGVAVPSRSVTLKFSAAVSMSVQFPEEPPTFTFLSVYHVDSDGGPFCKIVRDCPHSPRWSGVEMAERSRSVLLFFPDLVRFDVFEK